MLLDADKTYVALVRLGTTTATGDAEGEVLQLLNAGNPDVGEHAYLDVIRRSTERW